jgi:hypothetical protein
MRADDAITMKLQYRFEKMTVKMIWLRPSETFAEA